jgi:hypothetical protein
MAESEDESWSHTMSSRPVLLRAMEFHALVADQMGCAMTGPNERADACAALVTLAAAGMVDLTARADFLKLCDWCWQVAEDLKAHMPKLEKPP